MKKLTVLVAGGLLSCASVAYAAAPPSMIVVLDSSRFGLFSPWATFELNGTALTGTTSLPSSHTAQLSVFGQNNSKNCGYDKCSITIKSGYIPKSVNYVLLTTERGTTAGNESIIATMGVTFLHAFYPNYIFTYPNRSTLACDLLSKRTSGNSGHDLYQCVYTVTWQNKP
jgi:hypothetical protein